MCTFANSLFIFFYFENVLLNMYEHTTASPTPTRRRCYGVGCLLGGLEWSQSLTLNSILLCSSHIAAVKAENLDFLHYSALFLF